MVATEPDSRTRDREQNGNRGRDEAASAAAASRGRGYVYDPLGVVRVERLRIARQWAQQGATFQAIPAYGDMLVRYAGHGAADAAAEELLEMVPALEQQGKFYTVLDLLRKVEQGG